MLLSGLSCCTLVKLALFLTGTLGGAGVKSCCWKEKSWNWDGKVLEVKDCCWGRLFSGCVCWTGWLSILILFLALFGLLEDEAALYLDLDLSLLVLDILWLKSCDGSSSGGLWWLSWVTWLSSSDNFCSLNYFKGQHTRSTVTCSLTVSDHDYYWIIIRFSVNIDQIFDLIINKQNFKKKIWFNFALLSKAEQEIYFFWDFDADRESLF